MRSHRIAAALPSATARSRCAHVRASELYQRIPHRRAITRATVVFPAAGGPPIHRHDMSTRYCYGSRVTSTGWRVLAGVGAAILLAFVGAPLSVDQIFLMGPDHPTLIGEQFTALFCGAAATAAGILLARHWRWLLVAGSVGMVVAHAIRAPRPQGVSVRVAGSGSTAPAPDIVAHTAWVCLLVMSAAVLLIGVLAVAQEVLGRHRIGAALAGFAGCAGFLGVAVVGRLRVLDAPGRALVIAGIAALTVLAVSRSPRAPHPAGTWPRMVAAAAALVWLLPTMFVAIKGQAIFGTVTGGVVGLVVLGVAIAASRPAGTPGMLAVAATGLVLALPVVMLVLLYDIFLGKPWYAWPIAAAGVLVGAASAAGPWPLRAGIVAAAGLSVAGLAARATDVRSTGALVIWLFLALSLAAIATTVGSAAQTLATVDATPALGSLGPLAALGIFGTLNLLRVGANGKADLAKILGSTLNWISAALLLAAAALLLLLGRLMTSTRVAVP